MKKLVFRTLFVVMCISLLVLTFALGACDTDGEGTLLARFDGSGVISEDDDWQTVKSHITVTYTDSQGRTQEVNDFTLSGTLHEGTCEITVTYNGISTTVSINVSAVEQQFSIRFVVDDETYAEIVVDGKEAVVLPNNPSKDNFNFLGWCYDVQGNEAFDVNKAIESNLVLYAKWEYVPAKYVVTFFVGNSEFDSYSIDEGSQIVLPQTNPDITCNNFVGWVSADNQPLDANQTVNSNLEFYASFETAHASVVTDEAVSATCTESGFTEGSHCEVCGEVLVAQQDVSALGHDLKNHAAQAPTCTEYGWYAWEECQRAGCNYDTYNQREPQGHSYAYVSEVAAKCEKDGVKGHYHCSACEKDFDSYYEELTDLKIDALGHDIEHHEAQAPSCGSIGWNAYDVCKREGCTYSTYQEIAQLQHDMDADGKCNNCGYFDSGLELQWSSDSGDYTVVGLGTFTGTDVVIPAANADGKPITAIANYAFKDTNITSIEIPTSITHIGYSAFENCENIAKVNYLGTIDQWAQIEFNNITANPLGYAHNLYLNDVLVTEVKLTTATEIGACVFYNCTSITSVEITSDVTEIGGAAFDSCTSLESITISASVTTIGGDAFCDCENIAKVNYLGTIDQWAQVRFHTEKSNPTYYAKNLYVSDGLVTDVKLTTTTQISSYAFYNCTSITSIEIPESVTSIGYSAFDGCESFTKVNYLGTIDQWAGIDFKFKDSNPLYYAKNLYINDVLVTKAKITDTWKIGDYAFYNCTSLTSVEILSGVTRISQDAFYGCSNLESVTIAEGLTQILSAAFYKCTSLKSIEIPSSVTEIRMEAFRYCTSLKSVTLPANVELGGDTFADCSSLESIVIPNGVTRIQEFSGCTALKSITIPASVTNIASNAFYGCSNLATVTFSENSQLTSIGSDAFYNCSGLTSIVIPASVTSIGKDAFKNCYNLATVTFDENSKLSSIEGFSGCSSLTSIAIPAGVTEIEGSAFANCSGLKTITIPASVTAMGYNAFYGCSPEKVNYLGTIDQWAQIVFGDLTSNPLYLNGLLYINNAPVTDVKITTATQVNSNAFYGYDGLVSVELSSSVTSIGQEAFYNCENLVSVTIPASVTTIGNSAFYKSNALTIYCEAESKPDSWKNGWNNSYTESTFGLPVVWDCKNKEVADDGNIYAVIDGIRYALNGEVATVALQPKNVASQVSIPSSVTYKGANYAVTKITSHAFRTNNNLVSVTIPSGITDMGYMSFYGCNRLTIYCEVESKPSNWRNDWNYQRPVVWDCKNKEVATDKNIYVTIDGIRYALKDEVASVACQLNNSASVKIPSFVIYKDQRYSVKNIADNAFYGCNSLTSIEIPASVTEIGSCAFSGCSSLTKVNYLGTIDQWAEIDFADKSANPWWVAKNLYINDQLVTDVKLTFATIIEGYAFYGCSAVTNITIPASVKRINGYAFADCSNLVSVVISEGVEYIGGHAFTRCANLESITIPASVTFMGWNAFSGCNSLAKVNYLGTIDQWAQIEFNEDTSSNPLYGGGNLYINDVLVTEAKLTTATKIGNYAFSNCKSLTSIEIPASVTSIGESAFEYCSNLTSVTFEVGSVLGSIGDSAFADCSKLASITIPASVTSIGLGAFYKCSSLTSIVIPSSVTSIDSYAFDGCDSLTKVNYLGTIDQWVQIEFRTNDSNPLNYAKTLYINDVLVTEVKLTTATQIGNFVFWNCSFTSIEIPASVTKIGNSAFQGCSSLTTVTFGEGSKLKSIGQYAFYGCASLASITIPSSVTSVGNSAFKGCSSLASVTFGENSNLTTINSYAFDGCTSLASITIPSSVTNIKSNAFKGCSSLTIYCEAESQPSGWNSGWNSSNCTVVWNCKNSEAAGEEDA